MVTATSQSQSVEQKDQLEIEFEKAEIIRKAYLLRSVCLVMIILYSCGLLAYLGVGLAINQLALLYGSGLCVFLLISSAVCYRLSRTTYNRTISWIAMA